MEIPFFAWSLNPNFQRDGKSKVDKSKANGVIDLLLTF